MTARSTAMKSRLWLRGLILIVTLVAIGYAFRASGLGSLLDETWIDTHVRGHGHAGEALFFAIAALAAAVGLPRQFIAFLGGYAFGVVVGTGLALAAVVTGCVMTFTYSRLLGRDLVASRFRGRVERIDAFLGDHPFSMTLLIRLLPVGSNLVTNLAAGVSRVRLLPFVAGSAVGYLPQTLAFSLAGSGVNLDAMYQTGLAIVLFMVSAIIGVYLYRKHRHGQRYEAAVDEAIDEDEGPEGLSVEAPVGRPGSG